MSPSWTNTILEAAYQRGWLLRSVQAKVLFLLERGLHLEQALLGTGLLTMTQYAELVQEGFQISIERLDLDRWTVAVSAQALPDGVCAAIDEHNKPALLVSDAWQWKHSAWFKSATQIVPVFRSDLLRWKRRTEPVDFAVSDWWEALSRHQATEARVSLEQGKGEVWIGSDARALPDLELSREEIPAVQTWFEAGFPSAEWTVRRLPGVESDTLEMVHTSNPHPLQKIALWKTFLQKPNGVLLFLAPDAWLEQKIQHLAEPADHASLLAATSLVRIRPQTDADREAASHAAMAGCPLCWIEEVAHEYAWIRTLAQAGVPVHVIRSRQTPHGSSWEAYTMTL